jgi:DNA-binding NarL/FixJ family response regulator
VLTGHPPWYAKSDAALARVALARGRIEEAVEAARATFESLRSALREDLSFDILVPAAEAIAEGGTEEERSQLRDYLRLQTAVIANRIEDESIRARWFRGPVGSAVSGLAANPDAALERNVTADERLAGLDPEEGSFLELVASGLTNHEIGERLGIDDREVNRRLSQIYAKIGASSRADATVFAFQTRMI